MSETPLNKLALGGVIGPLLFTIIVVLCGSLRPNYDHSYNFISELGATGTSNELLMNFAGFIPTGILLFLFAISLRMIMPEQRFLRIGSIFIMLFGLGVMIAGIYSCDAGCPSQGSYENMIHERVSGPAFGSAALGILLTSLAFRKMPAWHRYWRYSMSTAILSFACIFGLINAIEIDSLKGVWQRLFLVMVFLWCIVIGTRVHKFKS